MAKGIPELEKALLEKKLSVKDFLKNKSVIAASGDKVIATEEMISELDAIKELLGDELNAGSAAEQAAQEEYSQAASKFSSGHETLASKRAEMAAKPSYKLKNEIAELKKSLDAQYKKLGEIRKTPSKLIKDTNSNSRLSIKGASMAGLSKVAGAVAGLAYPSKLGEGDDNTAGMKAYDFSENEVPADRRTEKQRYLFQQAEASESNYNEIMFSVGKDADNGLKEFTLSLALEGEKSSPELMALHELVPPKWTDDYIREKFNNGESKEDIHKEMMKDVIEYELRQQKSDQRIEKTFAPKMRSYNLRKVASEGKK